MAPKPLEAREILFQLQIPTGLERLELLPLHVRAEGAPWRARWEDSKVKSPNVS